MNRLLASLLLILVGSQISEAQLIGPLVNPGGYTGKPKLIYQPSVVNIPTGNTWTFQAASNNAGTSADIANVATDGSEILIACVKWENTGSVTALSLGGTSTNFTLNPIVDYVDGLLHLRTGYILNPPGGSYNNCTATTSGTCTFVGITIIRASASGTKTYDTTASGTNVSATAITGAFTTGAQKYFAVTFYGKYSPATLSVFLTDGNTATRTLAPENEIISWNYAGSTRAVNATSQATLTPSDPWLVVLVTFIAQ